MAKPSLTPPWRLSLAAVAVVLAIAAAVSSIGHDWSNSHAAYVIPTPLAPTPAPTRIPLSAADQGAKFVDVAAAAGIHYHWSVPGPRPLDILQTIGNGCAFLDYNNDSALDILLVGPKLGLYRGDGRGHFADNTRSSGLERMSGHFLGCAVGDYDNDGYDDIYISGYHTGVLLHNERGAAFINATGQAGVRSQPWGTSCAFGDVNSDGRLDLYVGNYVVYDPAIHKRLCEDRGHISSCSPSSYLGQVGALYLNRGGGQFTDVSSTCGLNGWSKTLGVAMADYDRSGSVSITLANDELAGELLKRVPGRGVSKAVKFQNVGRRSGTAYTRNHYRGGMGTDWGDYDNDGWLDLVVATFQTEAKSIYHNNGDGTFLESEDKLGAMDATLPYVAFGTKWLDYDNDGWLDLVLANGHVQDNIAIIDKSASYREPTQLFHNRNGRYLVDVSRHGGAALTEPIVGRGLAVGDYDNDGRVDVLIVDSEGSPLLLRNESRTSAHWLTCKLVGTHSNRDGIGAMVTVEAGGVSRTALCHTDGSYLSSSDVRVHIGLGASSSPVTVTVRWPSGQTDRYRQLGVDRLVVLREGKPV